MSVLIHEAVFLFEMTDSGTVDLEAFFGLWSFLLPIFVSRVSTLRGQIALVFISDRSLSLTHRISSCFIEVRCEDEALRLVKRYGQAMHEKKRMRRGR